MGRTVVAVIAGCVIFGLGAVVLFPGTGHSTEGIPTAAFAAVSVAAGLISAMAAGWTTARLAPRNGTTHALILAILMMFAGLASFLLAPGVKWAQLLMMFVFAPGAFAGGMMGDRGAQGNR